MTYFDALVALISLYASISPASVWYFTHSNSSNDISLICIEYCILPAHRQLFGHNAGDITLFRLINRWQHAL